MSITTTTPLPPQPPTKSKFLPSEILYTIFSHLSQPTLRQSVNPVCRQWRFISNHLIHRTATWVPVDSKNKNKKSNKNKNKNDKEVKARVGFHETLLDQLSEGKFDTFECWVLEGSRHPHKMLSRFFGHPGLWDEFVSAMHARLAVQRRNYENESDVEGEGGGGRLFESIRNLSIYGDMVDPMKMVMDLKPCFEFLETLKIEFLRGAHTTINIFTILDNGPRLTSIEIVVLWTPLVEITQGDTTTTATIIIPPTITVSNQASIAEELTGRQAHSSCYPLQQLILCGPWIDTLMTAERIIKTCPDLRVLKSIQIETSASFKNRTQWEASVMQEASKRLAEMARDHCPHLSWYQSDLQYIYRLPNETRLIELAQIFPEMRALSMMTYEDPGPMSFPLRSPYQPVFKTPFLPDLIHTFLNRLTVLEVSRRRAHDTDWTVVNRIICLCPHLQNLLVPDLLTMTGHLKYPSFQPLFDYQVVLNESLWLYDLSDKDSRQRERAERQHLRDLVLLFDKNDENNYPRLDPYRPVPRIWPCRHSLRGLDCCFDMSPLEDWTQHVRAYRLFGQLMSLKIKCTELKIGQVKDCPSATSKKSNRKSLSSSLSSAVRRGRRTDTNPRYRYRNDLWPLKGLVYLEEFVVEVARLPGTVAPEDFEFLRRKEPDFGNRFFPPPPPSLSSRRTTATRTRSNNGDSEEEEDSDDSEDENDYGRVEAYKGVETFWPRLTTFHIGYVLTHAVNDPKLLVPAVEQIRPGVNFRFKLSPNIALFVQ
ncbi:hypothetical protein BG015_003973 [Linnemannia schmuckeri]|uniref:F-box domain-containing protein n=1 Tax=Linnemannia schmuckeri TaxID=64567 RepID=A0A9P5VD20_9FUNG|nr:hypothetical protein BG015_003973 [Linnemannia schmuckeri]